MSPSGHARLTGAFRALLAVAAGLGLACGRESAAPAQDAGATAPWASPAAAAAGEARAPSKPIAVLVTAEATDSSPSPLVLEWIRELKAVFAVDPARFKPVESEGDAEVVVRITRVTPTPESPGHTVMAGSVLLAGQLAPFQLDYTGGAHALAGRFANYLAGQVAQARAAAPAPASARP